MALGRVAARGSRDIGIDLVAEDRDGDLWAIQAKHYDPAYSIKKADLDGSSAHRRVRGSRTAC